MLTDDESEQQIHEYTLKTQTLGFNTPEAYEEYKENVKNGFLCFGSPFLKSLGNALVYADLNDSVKIIRTWRSKCEEYSMLYRIFLAKQRAKGMVPRDPLPELNANSHEHNYEIDSQYYGKRFYKCGTCGKMKEELINAGN